MPIEDVTKWSNNGIQLETFDLVLTNPPFGKDIQIDSDISGNYLSKKIDIAFLERSINLLRNSGRLAIILSEVVFHAPTYKPFRNELIYKHNVTHLIDLPHDTFRPFNNAKCIVLILEKNKIQQDKIKLINLKEIGPDHKGYPKYEYDYTSNIYKSNMLDDTVEVIESFNQNHSNEKIIEVDSSKVLNNDILVPRYYFNFELFKEDSNYIEIADLIRKKILFSFEGHGSPKSHLKGMGEVPYIKSKRYL